MIVAIIAALFGGVTAYRAAHNELTGTAIYQTSAGFKSWMQEPVDRKSSPDKFRSATNSLWLTSGVSFAIAAIGITFFLKLDDCVDDYF